MDRSSLNNYYYLQGLEQGGMCVCMQGWAGVCGGQLVQERASVQNVVAVGVGQRAAGSERASLLPVYPCWFRNGKA